MSLKYSLTDAIEASTSQMKSSSSKKEGKLRLKLIPTWNKSWIMRN